jgi:hypothetical protein
MVILTFSDLNPALLILFSLTYVALNKHSRPKLTLSVLAGPTLNETQALHIKIRYCSTLFNAHPGEPTSTSGTTFAGTHSAMMAFYRTGSRLRDMSPAFLRPVT